MGQMNSLQQDRLGRNLTPLGAWAFAVGTSIGWGSLVITANTYLAQAGPAGSVLGMIVGGLIMLVISRSYAYMAGRVPESGGTYAYVRETFGYDYGFLIAWFLMLVYMAMLWANATALPLFFRYFAGEHLEKGALWSLFGYRVYLGEALLSIAAVFLVAFLCIRFHRAVAKVMIGMALFFAAAIAVCFAAAMLGKDAPLGPAFAPGKQEIAQVFGIACISPWAFIGFEGISHGAEEFSFRKDRIFRILVVSIISITLLYIFVTLLSVTAFPQRYGSWTEYIAALPDLSGIEALPAFYAAWHYLGGFGVAVLMIALLCLVFTSLIANITILSRLFLALGRDHILPERMAKLNRWGVPARGILAVACISAIVPFLGRTAIGWIVDVTTLGATLVYGFVSAAAAKQASEEGERGVRVCGLAGTVIMIAFGCYLTLPNLFAAGSMARESYFLFAVWSVLGFLYFRHILKEDESRRFGQSIVVWIALLSLILFVSLVWMSQSIMDATGRGMATIEEYYLESGLSAEESGLIALQMEAIQAASARSIIMVVVLVAVSLATLLNNYSLMNRRARESELQLGIEREKAARDPLTGVKSKHAYSEFEMGMDEQIRNGTAEDFAVAVCDVNGLKHVNDTLGHKAGDAYICSASALICELFGHSPVYRVGGDEFVVYLKGADHVRREEIMQLLHDRSAARIGTDEAVVAGGLADYLPGEDRWLHAVFERADALMYEEKQALKAMGARVRE